MIIRVKKKTHIIIVNFGYILIFKNYRIFPNRLDKTDFKIFLPKGYFRFKNPFFIFSIN